MVLFHLPSEDIMNATDQIFSFLTDKGTDKRDALKIRLTAEEVLLTYQKQFGEKTPFELYLEKRMGIFRVILRIAGTSFDPFGTLGEDDRLMHNLMENMGKAPVWSFHRSYNE